MLPDSWDVFLQELSSHPCPCVFPLSVTERIIISKIIFLSQKYNLIPSNFSTHFFLCLIPQRKFQHITYFHCGIWMSYRGQCCLFTGSPASKCYTALCGIFFFSRICYFLSQRGIYCRNEFTLALCHLILRTETLSLTFLRQTVMCYRLCVA